MAATDDDGGLSPPERLLHETRRESHFWLHQAIRAQAGIGEYARREALIELTASLENYWRLLRTPTREYLPRPEEDVDPTELNDVAALWLHRTLFQTEQGIVRGLHSLRDWWESERTVINSEHSVLSGQTKEVRREPVTLSVRQARRVIQRLDELAAELDVGYEPERRQVAEIDYSDLYPGEGPESLDNYDEFQEVLEGDD